MVKSKKKIIGFGIAGILGLGIIGNALDDNATETSGDKQLVSVANDENESAKEEGGRRS